MTTAAINLTYSNVNKSEMKILNPGSLPSTQGPSEYFTGKVRESLRSVRAKSHLAFSALQWGLSQVLDQHGTRIPKANFSL